MVVRQICLEKFHQALVLFDRQYSRPAFQRNTGESAQPGPDFQDKVTRRNPSFLNDPAADLAVASALVSALSERPVPSEAVVLGEIALSGEIRPVAHSGLRLKEAAKLGFETAWLPKGIRGGEGLQLAEFGNLRQLVDQILGR